jgi:hypothetical protein
MDIAALIRQNQQQGHYNASFQNCNLTDNVDHFELVLSVDVENIHVGWIKAIRPNPPKHPDVKTIITKVDSLRLIHPT